MNGIISQTIKYKFFQTIIKFFKLYKKMSDCNNELICWEPNDIITETPIAKNYVAWGDNQFGQLGNDNTT